MRAGFYIIAMCICLHDTIMFIHKLYLSKTKIRLCFFLCTYLLSGPVSEHEEQEVDKRLSYSLHLFRPYPEKLQAQPGQLYSHLLLNIDKCAQDCTSLVAHCEAPRDIITFMTLSPL